MDSTTGHSLGGTRVASSKSIYLVQTAGSPLGGAFGSYEVRSGQRTAIGRGPGNDIAFPADATEISRQHALLDFTTANVTIGDRSSTNGTFVNGERLTGLRRLALGDRFRLGEHGPEFRVDAAPVTATPPPTPPPPASDAFPGGPYERREAAHGGGSRVRGSTFLADVLPTISPNRSGLVQQAWPFAIAITIIVIALFSTIPIPVAFNLVLGLCIGLAVLGLVSYLAGRRRPWWLMLAVGVPAPLIMLYTPFGHWLMLFFRKVLPGGDACQAGSGIAERVFGCTVGVGLFEELMKILPAVVVALIALQYPVGSQWRRILGVNGPLDGIFLGAVSGVGFTLYETLGPHGYVARMVEGVGDVYGLELELPRLLGATLGHVAWTGYLGYALGLAISRRTPAAYRSLLGAYAIAALLHGIWDASDAGGAIGALVLQFAVGVASFMLLIGAIDRAKRLEGASAEVRAA
jgi:RsiW-degrading membrane proteinase PrsW (M82 family)